jgi:hypothetical protein
MNKIKRSLNSLNRKAILLFVVALIVVVFSCRKNGSSSKSNILNGLVNEWANPSGLLPIGSNNEVNDLLDGIGEGDGIFS